ncbi:hypothetical protein [Bradyrhizobium sp. USDA 223]|uniref:hypothetical protein n=1 Tax=Bradyrhizobium sp. USDA 223 TaxID=3156306 RepID=UPI00384F7F9E
MTSFDVVAAGYCLLAAPFVLLKSNRDLIARHGLPLFALALFILATLASASVAYDTNDHLLRSSLLAAGAFLMITFSLTIGRVEGLSFEAITQTLAISSAITGVVCIAQGKFGLFLNLLPSERLEFWTRPTGLAEHPVEAGQIAAYGCLFATSLLLRKRRIYLNGACLVIIAYSETISASLTGVICSIGCVLALLVARGSLKFSSIVIMAVLVPGIGFIASEFFSDTFLAARVSELFQTGLEYGTLNSRTSQMADAIDAIFASASSFSLGSGYDPGALISKLDIHNGLLASWYHFGLLGAASQLLFIFYFVSAALRKEKNERIIALLGLAIFVLFYFSGPAFFRRSVWLPIFLLSEPWQIWKKDRTATIRS